MKINLLILAILSAMLFSCEDTTRKNKEGTSNNSIQRNELPATFASHEVSALKTLCSGLASMQFDYLKQHEFYYKKDDCLVASSETYTIAKTLQAGDGYPLYSADQSRFYFKDLRLDKRAPLQDYCKRVSDDAGFSGGASASVSRIHSSNGLEYILEVVVNRQTESGFREYIKSSPGCYASGMIGSDTTNDLICLRLWASQNILGTNSKQDLYFDSSTFFLSKKASVNNGYFVHKKVVDFVKCTDSTKSFAYEAIRKK
jgi:hypothetical protein